ncbi:hypothetical protein EDC01DRAFT_674411, partial [Geopyxis carbonaria]
MYSHTTATVGVRRSLARRNPQSVAKPRPKTAPPSRAPNRLATSPSQSPRHQPAHQAFPNRTSASCTLVSNSPERPGGVSPYRRPHRSRPALDSPHSCIKRRAPRCVCSYSAAFQNQTPEKTPTAQCTSSPPSLRLSCWSCSQASASRARRRTELPPFQKSSKSSPRPSSRRRCPRRAAAAAPRHARLCRARVGEALLGVVDAAAVRPVVVADAADLLRVVEDGIVIAVDVEAEADVVEGAGRRPLRPRSRRRRSRSSGKDCVGLDLGVDWLIRGFVMIAERDTEIMFWL